MTVIHHEPNGVIWFGTVGGGAFRYDGKEFVSFTKKDGLVDNSVNAIFQESDKVIWFGTGFWQGVG